MTSDESRASPNDHEPTDDRTAESPSRERVITAYDEGVDAVEQLTSDHPNWQRPSPCGQWRALEVMGHLLAVVRYYHRLLDSALDDHPLISLPRGERLAVMNALDLATLAEINGDERRRSFVVEAREYGARLRAADWSRVLGDWSQLGELTIGQHTGVVLGEWHVHAWDLARSQEVDHCPNDAALVARAQSAVGRLVSDIVENDGQWVAVLDVYGRHREPANAQSPHF